MLKEKPHFQDDLANYIDIPFINNLPLSLLKSINNVAIYRSYIPKNYIIIEGKPCLNVFLLLKGKVIVFRTSYSGRRQVLLRLKPGDWLNASSCFKSEENNPAGALAITPVKMLEIARSDYCRLVKEYPQFSFEMMNNFSDRIEQLTNVIENLALRSTSGRIAHFLLEHADESGIIYWCCTQRDIADRLGTVADVVGRVLRKFADDGLIEMPVNNCIVIVDEEGLKKEVLN